MLYQSINHTHAHNQNLSGNLARGRVQGALRVQGGHGPHLRQQLQVQHQQEVARGGHDYEAQRILPR